MTWVVDASVAVKWFVEEDGYEPARRLVARGSDLIAPDLVVAEVCNVGWRLVRKGILPAGRDIDMANRIGCLFSRLWPLDALAPRAAALAYALEHPIYDCFYVALAEIEMTRLVTADRRLLNRLAASPWRELAVDLYSLPA